MRLAITTRRKQIRKELRQVVFDAAWHVVGSCTTPREQSRLRVTLAKLLAELEARGVTDPWELRRRAIEEMLLGPERSQPRLAGVTDGLSGGRIRRSP